MSTDHPDAVDRARIERMIEHYRVARMFRAKRRAMIVWRKLESRLAIVALEKPPERVH
jgi:hypothetical protein